MVSIKSNDLSVVHVPPQTDTDARVPTAEEMAAGAHLHTGNLRRASAQIQGAGVRNRPVFGVAPSLGVVIPSGLQYYAPGHPSLDSIPTDTTIQLPALADAITSISRYDQVYLVCFAAEVTEDIDVDIRFQFKWRNQANALQTLNKENTRRYRSFWAIAVSQTVITAGAFVSNLPTLPDGSPSITVNQANAGVAVGGYRLYAKDPNLVNTKTYKVIADTVVLLPLLRVWRVQNFPQQGFLWGLNGEQDFLQNFHLQPNYRWIGPGHQDIQSRAHETLWRILQGLPILNAPTSDRAVWNFVNGQVGGNPTAPGLATPSLNGSTALANTQRITFSNQRIVQRIYCKPSIGVASGPNTRLVVDFIESSPEGALFSPNAADHKVFNAAGQDVTNAGTFTGLGDTGALIWEGPTSSVAVGATAYVVPGIVYPSGSGFPQHGTLERVYLNGVALNNANIVQPNDITVFTAPAGSDQHIVIYNPRRAAIEKIYRRITIVADGSGIVRLPNTARGLIAFISGANAPVLRQDRAVITGLSANQTYTCLVYHAPPPTEQWQFQFILSRYKGTADKAFLNGARVASNPIAFATNLGGGSTTIAADSSLNGAPIAYLLPQNLNQVGVQAYQLQSPINFAGEAAYGRSLRTVENFAVDGAALKAGQILSFDDLQDVQLKALPIRLKDAQGNVLAISKPPLADSGSYEVVVVAALEKAGNYQLLIVTQNNGDPNQLSTVALQSTGPHYAAIDVFPLY